MLFHKLIDLIFVVGILQYIISKAKNEDCVTREESENKIDPEIPITDRNRCV